MISKKYFPVLFVSIFIILLFQQRLVQAKTIVDVSGQTIDIQSPFQRIISLYPAHTENLCSLGAADQLIGIGRSADYPTEILSKPRFSYRADPEKFIAAKPDLVLIRPMIERIHPGLIEKLRHAGITVFSLQPSSMDELFSYWKTLGLLTGHSEQAQAMTHRFQQEEQQIKDQVSTISMADRKRVYFESIHKRMKTFAPDSIAMYALTMAGGINVAADAPQVRKTNIADYGKERLLAKGNQIDIFLAQQGRMNTVSVEAILQEPGFKAIRAIRDKKVFLIDEHLVSRPTMRLIEGIRKINKILYPQLEINSK